MRDDWQGLDSAALRTRTGASVYEYNALNTRPFKRDWEYIAFVVRVIDGDTIVCNIDKGFRDWRREESVRLVGINAPEMRGATLADGRASRLALDGMVRDRWAMLYTKYDPTEKYGRWMASVIVDGINVNDWMVERGFAVRYME